MGKLLNERFEQLINSDHSKAGLNESLIPAEQVKPGMTGEDYAGHTGKVIKIVPFHQWKTLQKYDDSGWMYDKSFKELGIDSSDYLVAIKDEHGENVVYVYGYDGFACE